MRPQSSSIASGMADGPVPLPAHSVKRMFAEIGDFWRDFIKAAFDPYHPEQHYMRGPGPACAAKRAAKT
jgi:hypothetical protein